MNFMLIMKNEQSALVAVGPLAVEDQAAMLRDEIENSSGWTPAGIARVLTETQARELPGARQPWRSRRAGHALTRDLCGMCRRRACSYRMPSHRDRSSPAGSSTWVTWSVSRAV